MGCFIGDAAPRNSPLLLAILHNRAKVGTEMFAVVGLTLDDIWSGPPPHVRLAEALKARAQQDNAGPAAAQSIVIYTTDPTDTQGPITRAKYKEKGTLLTLLYLSPAAVAACEEFRIPLRIVDHVNESGLPARKVIAFQHSAPSPALK